MEWIELTKDNTPEGEVLAANFKPGTYGYKEKILGYISATNDWFSCENDHEALENCSHFIDIHKFDVTPQTPKL